jgi:hypothetical protein
MAWTTPDTYTAGQVLTAASMNKVSGDLNVIYAARRLAYQQSTSAYTCNQTALGSASDIFASDLTITADGANAYKIEWYFPYFDPGSTSVPRLHLVDGSGTDLSWLAVRTGNIEFMCNGSIYYTPSAGSASFNLRMTNGGSGSGTLGMGAGGAGNYNPGWMAVFGPDTLP